MVTKLVLFFGLVTDQEILKIGYEEVEKTNWQRWLCAICCGYLRCRGKINTERKQHRTILWVELDDRQTGWNSLSYTGWNSIFLSFLYWLLILPYPCKGMLTTNCASPVADISGHTVSMLRILGSRWEFLLEFLFLCTLSLLL